MDVLTTKTCSYNHLGINFAEIETFFYLLQNKTKQHAVFFIKNICVISFILMVDLLSLHITNVQIA